MLVFHQYEVCENYVSSVYVGGYGGLSESGLCVFCEVCPVCFLVVGKRSVRFVVVCSHGRMLIVVIMGKWSDDSSELSHHVRLSSVLATVVMSGDDVCCSVVFGTLVGVFVLSFMCSEFLMTSAISCPLWVISVRAPESGVCVHISGEGLSVVCS